MMATYTATERRNSALNAVSHGGAYGVKSLCSTVEVAVSTTVGRTIEFGRIPSNARVLGISKLYWDDLATSGSPTLDLGLAAVDGNLANADDPNALYDGGDVTSASTGVVFPTAIDSIGLPAWDFVASEASDPGGQLSVYGSMVDAPVNKAGTVTIEMYYVVD
jgi:hypothetical protein